jgi:5-keto 4-deoxyuronate isomerase
MKLIQIADAVRYPRMTTAELRATFLLDDLFEPDQVKLVYVDLDAAKIRCTRTWTRCAWRSSCDEHARTQHKLSNIN